jgi:beta-glucosidase
MLTVARQHWGCSNACRPRAGDGACPTALEGVTIVSGAEPRPALRFPDGFAWGATTASYQVEGAAFGGGRTPSIWDVFARRPGAVLGGRPGDIACDHYHRYPEDVRLLAELGAKHYRFSLAWPRLQPTGGGLLNPAGLDFYSRLVDALLDAGVQPWVTLYHWDLPQVLEDAGGWPERDTAYRFADYAALVHRRLADRVRYWTTVSQPGCAAFAGYATGRHAPGRTDPRAALRAAHHLMLAHGLAVYAMRAQDAGSTVGVTLNLCPVDPATGCPADLDAARRVDGLMNRLFLDPLFRGRYPSDVLDDVVMLTDGNYIRHGDEDIIAAPVDLLGVSYYFRHVVRATGRPRVPGPTDPPSPFVGSADVRKVVRRTARTANGWEIDPQGLYEVLARVHREYGPIPLYVTENGAAFDDRVGPDGTVADSRRVTYLDSHFRVAHRLVSDGVDLRGYFVYSLLDGFEWNWGYSQRFGMVHVDHATQQRTVKDSGHYFATVARNNVLPPEAAAALVWSR